MKVKVGLLKKPTAIEEKGLKKGKSEFAESSFASNRHFAWGRVLARYSSDASVDLLLGAGIKMYRVPVRSLEWMGSNDTVGFGERDLPPIDSLVLVVFPFGTVEEALVLCSAFTSSGIHASKQKAELLISDKESERLRITEAGVKITEDKETGDVTIEIPDSATLQITLNGSKLTVADDSVTIMDGSESFVKGDTAKTELDKDQALMSALKTALTSWTPTTDVDCIALKGLLVTFLALTEANYTNILSTKIKGE